AAAGCEEVWNAKALSAWWLHKHTQDDDLQFFICYSSLAAAFGNIGQSAYGAANRFLDTLSLTSSTLRRNYLSVLLPPVRGVGMFQYSLSVDSTMQLLNSMTVDNQFLKWCFGFLFAEYGNLLLVPQSKMQNSVKGTLSDTTLAEVRALCRKLVSSMLECENNIQDDDNLFELGLDSLGANYLATSLSQSFGILIAPTFVFKYSNLTDIAQNIASQLVPSDGDFETGLETCASTTQHGETDVQVAIIGVGMRLPGDVSTMEQLKRFLLEKCSSSGDVPINRWDIEELASVLELSEDVLKHLNSAQKASLLSQDSFARHTSTLFGISQSEFDSMDDAQRLLLELTYEAIHDAHLSLEAIKGTRTGVFIGASGNFDGVSGAGMSSRVTNKSTVNSPYAAVSKSLSIAAGRISHVYDLHGPCLTIDTACSSSLVALHNARKSLIGNECDSAIVAGVSVLYPGASLAFAAAGMLSPDGQCHTFDESANGYCRAEGCGAVVLKR
ncbi:KR domain-containing protein, partial [archaeon]